MSNVIPRYLWVHKLVFGFQIEWSDSHLPITYLSEKVVTAVFSKALCIETDEESITAKMVIVQGKKSKENKTERWMWSKVIRTVLERARTVGRIQWRCSRTRGDGWPRKVSVKESKEKKKTAVLCCRFRLLNKTQFYKKTQSYRANELETQELTFEWKINKYRSNRIQ